MIKKKKNLPPHTHLGKVFQRQFRILSPSDHVKDAFSVGLGVLTCKMGVLTLKLSTPLEKKLSSSSEKYEKGRPTKLPASMLLIDGLKLPKFSGTKQ